MNIDDLIIEDFDEPTPIKIEKKPKKCTVCNGKLVKVIYGDPTDEAWKLVEEKKAALGGCCIPMDSKILWQCLDCRQGYYK